MKHTHSRKKMLLSSIAMLLVALVALGSATYAWFAANPNATAEGLSLKTTAAAGLVIKTDSDPNWSHEAKLYNGGSDSFNLQPVSQEQSSPSSFWKVDAENSSAYTAKSGDMTTASGGTYNSPSNFTTGDYYYETVFFRLSDGSSATENASKTVKLTGVTITANTGASEIKNALRVAIAKEGELLGTWALTETNNGTLTGKTPSNGSFTPELVATSSFATKDLDITGLTASAADESKKVTVFVYLDGQDENCYSDKVTTQDAAKLIDSIKLDFTLADK